ncbi:MAG TPA: hypothetical protein VF815_19870 [Myxococcaceae bacterium]|jgi:hypothetical protein
MSSEPKSPESSASGAPRPEMNDAPPVLGSWRNIYLFVLGTLALLVALFWALTRAYA